VDAALATDGTAATVGTLTAVRVRPAVWAGSPGPVAAVAEVPGATGRWVPRGRGSRVAEVNDGDIGCDVPYGAAPDGPTRGAPAGVVGSRRPVGP
jgi:hypothetical protein